ncbi:hypothetical protein BH10PSE11_BH10PSE11_39600 [soil metagenome]
MRTGYGPNESLDCEAAGRNFDRAGLMRVFIPYFTILKRRCK